MTAPLELTEPDAAAFFANRAREEGPPMLQEPVRASDVERSPEDIASGTLRYLEGLDRLRQEAGITAAMLRDGRAKAMINSVSQLEADVAALRALEVEQARDIAGLREENRQLKATLATWAKRCGE